MRETTAEEKETIAPEGDQLKRDLEELQRLQKQEQDIKWRLGLMAGGTGESLGKVISDLFADAGMMAMLYRSNLERSIRRGGINANEVAMANDIGKKWGWFK